MKRLIALTFAAALAAPLISHAQVAGPDPEEAPEEGFSLMEEGARLLFRGILEEIGPALEGIEGTAEEMRPALRAFAEQMGPALVELLGRVDEIRHYEPPELLPNGDIIIRRRPDAPEWGPPAVDEVEPSGEIEL